VTSVEVELLLFAQAAELAGVRRVGLRAPPGATVSDLWELLRQQAPSIADALAPLRGGLAIARNNRYAGGSERIERGDVLALIPPVSGG